MIHHDPASVELHDDHVVKTFPTSEQCEIEQHYYQLLPDCCPRLLDATETTITVERCDWALEIPEWKPRAATRALLEELEAHGVHHRDAHARNLVRGRNGEPLLIDWEAAVTRAAPSYDLHGPDVSGIERPWIEHAPMWWDVDAPYSLGVWLG